MTAVQGWIAIALGIVTLASLLVAIGVNFGTLKQQVAHLADSIIHGFAKNEEAHQEIFKKIESHGEVLARQDERLGHLTDLADRK